MNKLLCTWLLSICITLPSQAINQIEKSLITGAIGDALGRVTEFISSTSNIFSRYPRGLKNFEQFKPDDWFVPQIFLEKKLHHTLMIRLWPYLL